MTAESLSNGRYHPTAQKLDDDDRAVLALQNLMFNICSQNGGDHGSSAIGMAAIGVALYKYVMRYNPSNPGWFDRDRFVLSNVSGVDVTTGPLGQGIANAVSLTVASKNMQARFNRPRFEIIQSRVYCMTGYGCLKEDVALEVISLAGSLKLDNLVLIYDNNQVTCDGTFDWINTEDINAKMQASGWHVLEIEDGSYDVQKIVATLQAAKELVGKPTHGEALQRDWDAQVEAYGKPYPDLFQELTHWQSDSYGSEWLNLLKTIDCQQLKKMAAREVNGVVIEKLWAAYPAMLTAAKTLSTQTSHLWALLAAISVTMATVANGLAAYNLGTFLPLTAAFFMFYLYAAPGVRIGALSNLPIIHCATHDSFAEGQNGPTYQPVEVDSLYGAIPILTYIRPCDAEETIGAWMLAIFKVARGAYVVVERENATLTLASCGTNLHYAVAVAETLSAEGIATRVVSAPSFEHFDVQDRACQAGIFPLDGSAVVSVEEYVATTWARYTTASIGMTGYGYSASNVSNYDRFVLDEKGIKRRRVYARMTGWKPI
ncbi:Transketolase, thiamine diphosphate binding domain-containing protein [Aspergillus pseudoustus]|uniref:Transketolase, thiamine diphosphate binding domain-containing protein n=1 Tax=Aspergillus pseudoustus TaxID=1810923 RepID=A0ABR4IPB8_9EURO